MNFGDLLKEGKTRFGFVKGLKGNKNM